MQKYIPRQYDKLDEYIRPGRVTVLYGPRRVGKTTLINNYLRDFNKKYLQATGDNIRVASLLESQDLEQILGWAEGYDAVVIDKAQRISNIGWALKLLIDARPEMTIIATGSASLDLANKLGEPLTGRQTPLQLFPVSILELANINNTSEISERLEDMLIYGMYPEVRTATSSAQKQFILGELVNSYLLRDVLEIERVKNAKVLNDLLALLAFQIGNEVSINELASQLSIDAKTAARYIDLLEKSYILYNLRGFSRNLRSEVTRTGKYYFYDTGVRNAIIANYNPLQLRNDIGSLWENFMVMERLKTRSYHSIAGNSYFWRTWEQKEIDLIEERGGELWAYEFKWSGKKSPRIPAQFSAAYPSAHFSVVTPASWHNFLLGS